MQELTLLKKYDAVLDVLYDISGKSPTFDRIQSVLVKNQEKIESGELWDILNTMIKDNFLYFVQNNQTQQELYLLSFSGKLLKEGGGLEKKLDREKIKEELDIKLKGVSINNIKFTRILAYASLILSLTLGVIQVIKFIQERNKKEQLSITPAQIERLLKSQQETAEHLQHIQKTFVLKDTSVKR